MTGMIALLGGEEHTPGCEPLDRRLLAEAGVRRVEVAVLLAASTPRRRAFKVAQAKGYWARLGAGVRFGFADRDDDGEEALAALAQPDLVVLTGGRPWLLHGRLDGSPVRERLFELWRAGVPLSGSSAGAMALAAWRWNLAARRPLSLAPSFGFVASSLVAPHIGRRAIRRTAAHTALTRPDLHVLGLADRAGLLGRDREFEVVGTLPTKVWHAGTVQLRAPGATLSIATLPVAGAP